MTKAPQPSTKQPSEPQKYINFYKIMLILSTIGTSIALIAILNLRTAFEAVSIDPAYGTSSIAGTLLGGILSISALILLWQKHPAGIWLKLSAYVVSIITSIIALFTSSAILSITTKEAITELSDDAISYGFTDRTVESIVHATYYAAMALAIFASIVFAVLWWRAWKKQLAHDLKSASKKSN